MHILENILVTLLELYLNTDTNHASNKWQNSKMPKCHGPGPCWPVYLACLVPIICVSGVPRVLPLPSVCLCACLPQFRVALSMSPP